MHGPDGATLIPTPRLRAVEISATGREPGAARAHCDWCERPHHHSLGGGHRVAHCAEDDSPYKASGYILDPRGETEAPAGALFLGKRRLAEKIGGASAKLRAALLTATIGGQITRTGTVRVGRGRISLYGKGWSVDPDAYPTAAELAAPPRRSRIRFGTGILDLLSTLYGVTRGVVGVRLLEAVAGANFGRDGRALISAAIEQACLREAPRDGS